MHRLNKLKTTAPTAQYIHEHLQKIFKDPLFLHSHILKKFLFYIITETQEGRSLILKEYTIGINVLNKHSDFSPQTDAIVRIHACRLRRALASYYDNAGKDDPIRISVPKGNYSPVYLKAPVAGQTKSTFWNASENTEPVKNIPRSKIAAVLPFRYFTKDYKKISFAEGLSSQLSMELSGIQDFSVVAYNPMRFLYKRLFNYKEAILKSGVQYLFSGDIHFEETQLRMNIQMINVVNNQQIWCQHYNCILSGSNMFDIQDKIIKNIITEINKFTWPEKSGITKPSVMAVA